MEWSKVKSMLIALLAAVNVLLALNIYFQLSRRAGAQREAFENSVSLLQQAGVEVEPQLFEDMADSLPLMQSQRSTEIESQVAQALLGKAGLEEAGGGISIYTSSAGSVIFRSEGVFEAVLHDGKTAAQLLDAILETGAAQGISCEKTERADGVSAQLLLDGLPVTGAVLECSDTGQGARASGRWYFGQELQRVSFAAERCEMMLALLTVLDGEPAHVTGVSAAYRQEPLRGGVQFVPVWQIETEKGRIVISGTEKKEITAE